MIAQSLRVALVCESAFASVDQVFQDIRTGLANVRPDWVVDILPFAQMKTEDLEARLRGVDIIHLESPVYSLPMMENTPTTANVWHDSPRLSDLKRVPNRFIVEDVATLQALGRLGHTNVNYIPMAFDPSRWPRLAPPNIPFTVGVFGIGRPEKRFEVVRRACREAKVECYMMVVPVGFKRVDLDPLEDVYSGITAFAHASFHDTSCRPALEALACGIPVFSTRNEGLGRVFNGGNILFYDGSVHDLARKISEMQEKLEWHRECAAYTPFPSLDMIALKYAEMFEEILEEEV